MLSRKLTRISLHFRLQHMWRACNESHPLFPCVQYSKRRIRKAKHRSRPNTERTVDGWNPQLSTDCCSFQVVTISTRQWPDLRDTTYRHWSTVRSIMFSDTGNNFIDKERQRVHHFSACKTSKWFSLRSRIPHTCLHTYVHTYTYTTVGILILATPR